MAEKIKNFFHSLAKSRLLVFTVIIGLLFALLIQRLFVLQIVNGKEYLTNYTLKIKKERDLPATRGNIFDRNGELLAYNELAYSVTIEDNGTYDSSDNRNQELNKIIANAITIIEKKGDSVDNNFDISYENGIYAFKLEGTSLSRFLADVYGKTTIDELEFDEELGYNQATASPKQVIDFLKNNKFKISSEYEEKIGYQILVVRYALSQNYYRKYLSTTIATDVSEKTVAAIKENSEKMQGVTISEDTIRKYVDSKYFAHIIGYTGKISQTEYDELHAKDTSYSLTDTIGKSGVEQVMEQQLQGKKGREKFYVDNLGKVVEVMERKEATTGNDLYLSIDKELQKTVYDLLEQEIAGILYSKITNIKEYRPSPGGSASDILVPIDDVYFALINNNVIDIESFAEKGATKNEKKIYAKFKTARNSALSNIKKELNEKHASDYKDLSQESQVYLTYMVSMLFEKGYLRESNVDKTDAVYLSWKEGECSIQKLLKHAIAKNWIDISLFEKEKSEYSDSTEVYKAFTKMILSELKKDTGFHKKLYKYMIRKNEISGTSLCLILFEQDVLAYNKDDINALETGILSSYDFLKKKIKKLEITPAQLALDPCSGSCVITDPRSGDLLACVTYPGYDNNKLANGVDSDYFSALTHDLSLPLYNYATQQETAPGSTFKPVTASAALTEGVITEKETILDKRQFDKVSNKPKCWIYPSSHGSITVSEAIQHSCNYFFYEAGYRLSLYGGTYNDEQGIKLLTKYAKMFGLDEKTGIEIPESSPEVATEFPVMAAIGQSNHNYTTVQLASYLTAIANKGTVYYMTLLEKVTNTQGKVIKEYGPKVQNEIDAIKDSAWNEIHIGMKGVVEKLDSFKSLKIQAAGKTGTAQETTLRPNHALFIGFAPYDNPKICVATRIAFGYTSANAAELTASVMKYCFDPKSKSQLLNGQAKDISGTTIHD
ncbi:MAG: penicillin-binding transpeptidase domain-containing protein [Lachnospiraceae bacterium]